MAERQETSVMASIQDILRDAQLREEQEKVAVQRAAEDAERQRVDAIRRQQEAEESRIRQEDEERQRRAHDEQRRQAELAALHEATVQRARMEAEAQARLAEMAAHQEHERKLNEMKHDKGKKRLLWGSILLGVLLIGGGVTAGVVISQKNAETEALNAQILKANEDKKNLEDQQSKLAAELANTKDPETIKRLEAQLAEGTAKIDGLNKTLAAKGQATGAAAATAPKWQGGGGAAPQTGGGPPPCARVPPRRSGLRQHQLNGAPSA